MLSGLRFNCNGKKMRRIRKKGKKKEKKLSVKDKNYIGKGKRIQYVQVARKLFRKNLPITRRTRTQSQKLLNKLNTGLSHKEWSKKTQQKIHHLNFSKKSPDKREYPHFCKHQ